MFSSVLTVSLPSLFWVTLPSNVKLDSDSCTERRTPFGRMASACVSRTARGHAPKSSMRTRQQRDIVMTFWLQRMSLLNIEVNLRCSAIAGDLLAVQFHF